MTASIYGSQYLIILPLYSDFFTLFIMQFLQANSLMKNKLKILKKVVNGNMLNIINKTNLKNSLPNLFFKNLMSNSKRREKKSNFPFDYKKIKTEDKR